MANMIAVLEVLISYNRFEAMVTDMLCRGSSEGWVKRPSIPPRHPTKMPIDSDKFVDEERFVAELDALAESTRKPVSSPD